jgi:hypothetical protein
MLISPKPVLSNKDEYWAVRTETYWDRSYLKVSLWERMGAGSLPLGSIAGRQVLSADFMKLLLIMA